MQKIRKGDQVVVTTGREKGKAREWYDRAMQWMDKNQPTDEELLRFRAEAAELLVIEKKKD